MTNREYLKNLSNEELACFIDNPGAKDADDWCKISISEGRGNCERFDGCEKCIKEWLDSERKTELKVGQVRKMNASLILIASVREDHCIVISEMGAVVKVSKCFASKYEITDITEDEFMRRLFENL